MTDSSLPQSSSDGAKAASVPTLDVFALRDSVVDEYRRFATSFTTIHAQDIREQVAAIYAEDRYWPEPLIQINPSYKRTTDVSTQVANGVLHPGCGDIFSADGQPLSLYKHQEQAVALAAEGESFVVTTGTGSGKSLCFFIPIVSHVLAARRANAQRRTQAVVVYPMNALANSQMEELSKFIDQVPGDRPITFARYTGQEEHGPAEAGGRRSAGHPSYQLHDARTPDDAAGRTRPAGHRQLRGPSLPRPGRTPHVPRPPGCRRGAAGAPCP